MRARIEDVPVLDGRVHDARRACRACQRGIADARDPGVRAAGVARRPDARSPPIALGAQVFDSLDELDPATDGVSLFKFQKANYYGRRLWGIAPDISGRVLVIVERLLVSQPRRVDSDPPNVRRWRATRAKPDGLLPGAHLAGTLILGGDVPGVIALPVALGTTVAELLS